MRNLFIDIQKIKYYTLKVFDNFSMYKIIIFKIKKTHLFQGGLNNLFLPINIYTR